MDAHALLTSQGWRGTGHSLHSSSDSIGLSRPLLVSKKSNTLGVGKKQHKTSDMWWMNAFDKSLQGLDTSKEGEVVQTITNGGLDMVAKGGGKYVGTGGLYSCFVRGEGLSGTLMPLEPEQKEGINLEAITDKKRKREHAEESKEERRERKAAKRASKAEKYLSKPKIVKKKYITVSPESSSDSSSSNDDEDSARALKMEKSQKAKKAAKKEAKRSASDSSEDVVLTKSSKSSETKEERKARRKLERLSTSEDSREKSSSNKEEKKKKRRKD